MVADIPVGGHGLDEFVADVFRVVRRESYSQRRVYHGDGFQQVGEVNLALTVLPEIRVHILSEQGDFLVAFREHIPRFGEDGLRIPAALSPAGVRHDTVRADIVAASHYGDEG